MAEQRQAKTRAWLETHELEESTRGNYVRYAERHIYPAFGDEPIGKVTTHVLERLYAELRRCGSRCGGRPFVVHRVEGPHECRDPRRAGRDREVVCAGVPARRGCRRAGGGAVKGLR